MKLRDAMKVGGALVLSGLSVASGCAREKPPVVTSGPPQEGPDMKADLVAVLPNQGGVLCARPDEVQHALERLGAKPEGNGVYRAELSNAAGERRAATFEVLATDEAYLCSNRFRKTLETPSPLVDLVAYMPKSGDRLCVRPEHTGPVLERLGARPLEGDRYVVLDRRAGEPVERLFRLVPRPAPILCAFGGDDEDDPKPPVNGSGGSGGAGGSSGGSVAAPVAGGGGSVAVPAGGGGGAGGAGGGPANAPGGTGGSPVAESCDPSGPYRACEEDGVWTLGPEKRERFRQGIYVIYDNADCNETWEATVGTCLSDGDRYRRDTMQTYKVCGRGTGYCVGALTIVGVRRYYDNDHCGGEALAEEPQRAGACYEGGVAGGGWLADDPIFEDSFTLYRNASCHPVTRAFDRDCEDSRHPDLGRYEREHYDFRHLCKKGSGYCAETWSKIGTRTYYDLRDGKECRAATHAQPILGAMCLP